MFFLGSRLYLNYLNTNSDLSARLAKGTHINGPVLIDKSAKVGKDCCIGPHVVIGPNVVIEDGVRIINSTVLSDTVIRQHSFIGDSIIGRKCSIGRWIRLEGTSVLGDDVVIKDEIHLNGAQVLPNKSISENVPEPKVIM